MLDAALDGIISIDHEGTVLEFNPAAEQMFGYRREDVLGRQLADLVIPPSLREHIHGGCGAISRPARVARSGSGLSCPRCGLI
jgi:PAS domain S-box-containing protein